MMLFTTKFPLTEQDIIYIDIMDLGVEYGSPWKKLWQSSREINV